MFWKRGGEFQEGDEVIERCEESVGAKGRDAASINTNEGKEDSWGTVCHVGTPTPSLRRLVKPLAEHNRSRSHSPALGSLSVKDKRTPRAQKTMLTGVDLTRRFADSIHGPCSLSASRVTAEFRSPRGSPSLDRIQEGCSSSLGRERKGSGTTLKSRLRGGDETPTVKKAITFSTPFGKDSTKKDSIRKHGKLAKRKDLNEHFSIETKNDDKSLSSIAAPLSTTKPIVDRHAARDLDFVSRETNQLDSQSKVSMVSDLRIPKNFGFRGKSFSGNAISFTETSAARNSITSRMTMNQRGCGTTKGRSFAKDAPCRLAFDGIELSPQGPKSICAQSSGIRTWKGGQSGAAGTERPQDSSDKSESVKGEECDDGDVMLSPLPCKSPEVSNRCLAMDERGLTWELQEDSLAQEWFHSRDMACFESFNKGSKTPEAQPSKSPELSRRAIGPGGVGTLLVRSGVEPERLEDVSNQQTPSPQPTNSPEFLKRGSVPPSSGGCFGAGPLMGPEGMRSVKDRRKCKPRGILTIEGEFLFSSGSADFLDEEVQIKETVSVPALASVEWMVAEGYDVASLDYSESSDNRDRRDVDANLKVSPGSLSHLRDIGERDSSAPCHRRCRSAVESGTDQVFWKKGLLYEWNLSLSDEKRAASPTPLIEGEVSVSPVGKLRNFSPDVTLPSLLSNISSNSLVIGALGSLTNTPSSCRASDFAGEEEVESRFRENLYIPSDSQIDHGDDDDLDRFQGLTEVEQSLQELCLDGQAPSVSMSFSLDFSPDSGKSWQGIHTTESAGWSNDSRGEWGDHLSNLRYKDSNSQFRFHSSGEEYTSAAKVDSYSRSVSREVSPSTLSVGYSDEGDSVVCTPSSIVTTNFSISPQMPSFESPFRDTWKKYCTVGKSAKDVGMPKGSGLMSTTTSFIRDPLPDQLGISISISDAPSLDSSSDDFEDLRYHHYNEGRLMNQVHTALLEREEGSKLARGRVLLHEADYSPSSLLKADGFRGVSVSGIKP